eukprot:505255-Hanusia_phi.AAC.1
MTRRRERQQLNKDRNLVHQFQFLFPPLLVGLTLPHYASSPLHRVPRLEILQPDVPHRLPP